MIVLEINKNEKGQAVPRETVPLTEKNFAKIDGTEVYWLGNASIFIKERRKTPSFSYGDISRNKVSA